MSEGWQLRNRLRLCVYRLILVILVFGEKWDKPPKHRLDLVRTVGGYNRVHLPRAKIPPQLPKEDEAAWLNPDTTEPAELLPLLKPYPAERMEEWLVDGAARNSRNDRPEVMQPVKEETNVRPEQGRLI
jgi:hypothetical protein